MPAGKSGFPGVRGDGCPTPSLLEAMALFSLRLHLVGGVFPVCLPGPLPTASDSMARRPGTQALITPTRSPGPNPPHFSSTALWAP